MQPELALLADRTAGSVPSQGETAAVQEGGTLKQLSPSPERGTKVKHDWPKNEPCGLIIESNNFIGE